MSFFCKHWKLYNIYVSHSDIATKKSRSKLGLKYIILHRFSVDLFFQSL